MAKGNGANGNTQTPEYVSLRNGSVKVEVPRTAEFKDLFAEIEVKVSAEGDSAPAEVTSPVD